MTRKEFAIKIDNIFRVPISDGFIWLAIAIYYSIMYLVFQDNYAIIKFPWVLADFLFLYISVSSGAIITFWTCHFLAKRLLVKDITPNKIFTFSLLNWASCVPLCIIAAHFDTNIDVKSNYPIDSFYIRLIVCMLVASVNIVQCCCEIIQQKNEEKIKLIEELKSEQETATRAQLNVLKLQLDPHFMFNSLGTLSGIITENPQKALDFTSRLSRIYKYIVMHINDDSIPLRDGMSFIQDYCQHIEMRYKDNFVFDIATDICHDDEEKILPLSLQLLVENAVKHNQHSVEHPLHIRIYRDGDFVCVSNELVPYTEIGTSRVDSMGIGIKNLFDRYKLLTNKIPIVMQSTTHYTVQIPIVKEIRDLKKSSLL